MKISRDGIIANLYRNCRYFYSKHILSDEQVIRGQFRKRLKRNVDLENPVLFNDKIQWLKLNWYDSTATLCADKYEVRDFVKKRIGEQYLNELYGTYKSVKEIDLDKLPKQFVLKATHGSGTNIICEDKDSEDWKRNFRIMRKWLKKNMYWTTREWVYKDIVPKIVCEKYLGDETGTPPNDYKIFCFDGKPQLIQVDIDRFNGHKQVFYNLNWTPKHVTIDNILDKNIRVDKPETLEKMLELSEELSKGFPHVRVDFYSLRDQIIFGELTFFHRNGLGKFNPSSFEKELGDFLKLPKIT